MINPPFGAMNQIHACCDINTRFSEWIVPELPGKGCNNLGVESGSGPTNRMENVLIWSLRESATTY